MPPPVSRPVPIARDRAPTLDLEDEEMVEEPPPAAVTKPAPPVSSRPTVPAVKPAPPLPVPAFVPPPVFTPPPPSSIPVPIASGPAPIRAPSVPRAPSLLDPMDMLFEGMYELNFAETASDAAGVCAEVLASALFARSVVVHAHDLGRREIRAIGASGQTSPGLLGSFESSDDDFLGSAVVCNLRPVTMRWDGELPRLAPRRFHGMGAPRTVIAVPAIAWGRCVAIIEIVDPDERYMARVADAAAYVAERFAQFLSHRAAA